MNSVHLVTQEKYRVEPGPKTESECTKPQPGPAGPACAHRPRARGRVVGGLAVSWPSPPRPCRSARLPCRSAASAPLHARASARLACCCALLCPAPACPAACSARPRTHARPLALRAPALARLCRLPRARACAHAQRQHPLRARPHASHARLRLAPSALHARLRPRLPTPAPAARPVRPSARCLLKGAVACFRFCTNFFFFLLFYTQINLQKFIFSIFLQFYTL